MSPKRRNFIYIRSAYKNDDSIEAQRACIQKFREKHPGLPPNFEEVIDNGYSNSDFDAPGIKGILELAEKDQVDVIIVSDISRLSRNYIEVGKFLTQFFPQHGVRLIVVNTSDEGSEESQIKFSKLRRK